MVVVAALLTGYYRVTYHTFAFWGAPARINWCGRDYDRGGVVGATALREPNVRRVASIPPLFRPVYAVNPQPRGHGQVCAMTLLYDTVSGQVVSYALSGGP